jgi:hypothetical protein
VLKRDRAVTGPAAEVAQVRIAVRRALDEIGCPADTPLLVACSGGADSTALAAAAAHLGGGVRGGGLLPLRVPSGDFVADGLNKSWSPFRCDSV